MALADEKYIRIITYKRDGTAVSNPVWVVPLKEGRIGFYTSSGSGKAKRLAHTDTIVVQPSDGRGRVKAGTEPSTGTARIVTGAELDEIHGKIKAKYGWMTSVAKTFGSIAGFLKRKRIPYADRGVVVTLNGESAGEG